MIELEKICKSFDQGKSFIVKDVSMTINDGEVIVFLGSSGCGKTTTLKMINRLITPTSGTIKLDDKNILDLNPVQLRRQIGYVFQGVGLFPHMTVAENVSVLLKLLKKSKVYQAERAKELLTLVNLDPEIYANRQIQELSGGQQQRVGVARALANDPKYLLMDEPFGALDAITRNSLQDELLNLNQQLRKTIIFVTHDIFEAFRLADRIVVMHNGEIQQIGTKRDLIDKPATDFVQGLIDSPKQQLKQMHDIYEL